MFINSVYYAVKPFLPVRLRMELRRRRAKSRRAKHADVWPINESAAFAPSGWPGWPDGKQFAVVLTHDVEGTKGLARVESLMELELKHGFRSSFNFVPEGEYRVSETLRKTLSKAGFEVGVHGLKHDGMLYASKEKFAARAGRINRYLQDWQASGFRSPFMQHRLGWLHQLNVEYDASAFDTDPFEPESDGAATIFPFWVGNGNGGGFVELPYTLVQDITLFSILQEANIQIWKQKLDWIAQHGGMALLNTHPDYMCFEGAGRSRCEYAVSHYEEFLAWILEKYQGSFWSVCARDIARFCRTEVPGFSQTSRKKICMVAYTTYEFDNRVRRYAEALVKRGDCVDVIAVSGRPDQPRQEQICGVTVYRIQNRDFNERHKRTYAWRLLRFLWASSTFLARRHQQIRYDLVHVHNMPDFLVFAAWYPKRTGAKVILDIHDIVPELFANKFKAKPDGLLVRLLKAIEKESAAYADHVIVANHLWYQKLISRSVPQEKCSVFLNHVDSSVFYTRRRTRTDDRIVILFPGSYQWHQGLDIAIKALARLRQRVPNAEFHLYGGGARDTVDQLVSLAKDLGLNGSVKFCGEVVLDRIAEVIANADLGVVPKRADSFGNEAYSTKIMEFMSQGVPVIVSRTKIDSFYFNEQVVRFFKSGDDQDLANAMMDLIEHPDLRQVLTANAYKYVELNSWNTKQGEYFKLVDGLLTEPFDKKPRQRAALEVAPFHGRQ
jgi:glycosyltransferase involved in cell wall biosynthesis/peptidoglycan/xylan/chitin deacetylase (PgdA/CDA1 family)